MNINPNWPSAANKYTKEWISQCYIDLVYQRLLKNAIKTVSAANLAQTYGEISAFSLDKLISLLTLNPEDSLLDLGSGLGKVVVQFFLNTPMKEVWGIEIVSYLHQQALAVATHIERELPEFFVDGRKLAFLEGDFLKLPFPPATILFVNPICFGQDLLNPLGEIINQSATIHTVLSLRPLSTLQRLKFKRTVVMECSWEYALCYIYTKNG